VPQEIAALDGCPSLAPKARAVCDGDPGTRATWLNDDLYPPTYYTTMGTLASTHVVLSTIAIRIVNVLLAAALLLVALLLAPPRLGRAYLLALVIGLIPLGLFLVASTNPSGWMVIGAAGLWVFAATWLVDQGAGRRRRVGTAVALVVSAVLLTARGDGAVLAAAILAAALVLHSPQMSELRRPATWWPFAAVVGCSAFALLTSSQVGVHSSGMKGEGSPSSGYEALPPAAGLDSGQVLVTNLLDYPRLVAAALGWPDEGLGGLGWLDVRVPALTGFVMLVVLGAAVLLGLSDVWRRKALAATILLVPLVVFPLVVLQRGGHVVGLVVQGRYLLPVLIVFLAILMSSRASTPAWPTTRAVGLALGTGLWLAQATALLAIISFYQWTPWPELPISALLAVGLIGSAGFSFSVVATLGRQSRLAG
jgi:hypothetical protein